MLSTTSKSAPQGQTLRLSSRRKSEQVYVYTADVSVCNACPVKVECTDSKSGRHIFRSFFQEDLDRVKAYQETEAYQKAMRKRALWTEPLFGEAKQFHQMRRFRLRGLTKVNIEGVLIATGQNLKRLIKAKTDEIRTFFKSIFLFVKLPQNTYFFNML